MRRLLWLVCIGLALIAARPIVAQPLAHQATVTFTDAQIKAWPISGATLVPASGVNIQIVPIIVVAQTRLSNGGYGCIDPSAYAWFGDANGSWLPLGMLPNDTAEGLTTLTVFLTNYTQPSGTALWTFQPAPSVLSQTWGAIASLGTPATNTPLGFYVSNTGSLCGGDGSNSITFSVSYLLLNATTGLFE